MSDTTELAKPMTVPPSNNIYRDIQAFQDAQRVGKMFADSSLVPDVLKGKVADCTIAYGLAMQLGQSPLTVMQSIYFANGKAGWSASYMIALANASGVFRGPIAYRVSGKGDGLAVEAYATLSVTGDEVSATVSMEMAKAEGWTRNKKYQTMPELMLKYRSATLLIRTVCPEVMLGLHTAEELQDVSASRSAQAVSNGNRKAFAEVIDAEPSKPKPTIEPTAPPEPVVDDEIIDAQADAPQTESIGSYDAFAVAFRDVCEAKGMAAEEAGEWLANVVVAHPVKTNGNKAKASRGEVLNALVEGHLAHPSGKIMEAKHG